MANNFWLQLNKPILALAPMEGVTDVAYRTICKRWGADVVYTEFISVDAIRYNAKKALAKMVLREDERPVICQIFGKDPANFAIAAKAVQDAGFDGLDINFGCPARKVVSSGSGVALLRDPQYARKLIEAALSTITIPLSIKVRTSIRKEAKDVMPGCEDRYTALDLVDAIQDLPVSAIMVHGRSYEKGHQGDIDTDMIRKVKAAFPGIVLANGGIFTPERALEVMRETGVDGVGIARGSQGQPWIFSDIRRLLEGEPITEHSPARAADIIRAHAALLYETKGAHGLIEFRKHFASYVSGVPGARALRARAVHITSLDDVEAILADLVHAPIPATA